MCFSDNLIFQPPPPSYDKSMERVLTFPTSGGDTLAAVYLPAGTQDFTIFFTHGNAEDLGHLMPLLKMFNELGFGVFSYDYRGYGLSSGRPSEKKTYIDSETAFAYLTNNLGVTPEKIILHGRSVGGGAVVDLAVNNKVAGLILESSFVTAFRVLTRIPILPFDKFKNIDKIKKVNCPVLIIHGLKDRIIAPWHGKKLFEAANEPKLSYWVEGAGHNNLILVAGGEYFERILDFATRIAIGELKAKQ